MKFNNEPKPGFSSTNKKQVAKFEAEKKRKQVAAASNADYLARQKQIQSAFGKGFKTGPAGSDKNFKREKFQGNKDY